ncbi:hypothetical protein LTR51_008634 [Lithohypha guttulata]|nr:hypothetical protein LTR51_008634 [Lithohypha guttulata]
MSSSSEHNSSEHGSRTDAQNPESSKEHRETRTKATKQPHQPPWTPHVTEEGRDLSSLPASEHSRKRKADRDQNERMFKPLRSIPEARATGMPDTWSRRFVSVWSEYSRGYEVNFGGGFFHMASKKSSERGLGFLQKLSSPESQHLVRCLGCFESPPEVYFVFEPMNMSLLQVSNALRLPSEQEIVAIACQLVEAAKAMASYDIVHGRLKTYNILVNLAGEVKIFLDESCHIEANDPVSRRRNVQALGDIVSELATISDTDRTLSSSTQQGGYSSELLEFLNETNRGDLASLAQQHPFLAKPWKPTDLQELFYLSYMSSRFLLRDAVGTSVPSNET